MNVKEIDNKIEKKIKEIENANAQLKKLKKQRVEVELEELLNTKKKYNLSSEQISEIIENYILEQRRGEIYNE